MADRPTPGAPEGDDVAGRKAVLRARVRRSRRDAAGAADRRAADAGIRRLLLAVLREAGSGPVGLYAALPGEVDVDAVAGALLADGTSVAYPRVTGPGTMTFHAVAAVPRVPAGMPPIREPSPTARLVVPAVVVVPGLAMDAHGGRLGHGGGFYDRWLAAHPDVAAVGVCRSQELVDAVPADAHDVPLRAVVTEGRVYR